MKYEVIHLKDRFPFLGEDGKDPNVTLYLPDPMWEMGWDEKKRPCMVVVPGGGYGMVSQREAEPIAFHFLPQGYNVFVIRYSVAPHRFPTQLREVAALMELIYENAEKWHCDTDRIAIMGFSAGGHLAAHYSTCYDIPEVREVFPESKPVQASILCYPVITADPKIAHLGSFKNLLGVEELTPEQEEKFSCDKQATEKTPPAFLWHTFADSVVPVANTLCYARALADHNIPVSVHIYPAGGHGLATVDDATCNPLSEDVRHSADWLDAVKKWLDVTFR